MLSVAALPSGGQGYYLGLVAANYYAGGREPPGIWSGSGVREFGLVPGSVVAVEHLSRLCDGFDPHDPSRRLVWNAGMIAGRSPRAPGTDLTFSCPKSVSILWACSDEETQAVIERIVLHSAEEALGHIERHCGLARVGRLGVRLERVPLTFALFPQSSSRSNDMQLHIHCLLVNATRHADGRTTAIDPTHLYHHQHAAGTLFRVAVAEGLRRHLGIETELKASGRYHTFEVKGIDPQAIEHYSKRSADIVGDLGKKGLTRETSTAGMKELSNKGTRKGKEERPRSELIGEWKAEAARLFGITPEGLRRLHGRVTGLTPYEKGLLREAAFHEGMADLEEQHSHWDIAAVYQKVAEHAQARGLSAGDVRRVVEEKLDGPELIRLGELRTARRTVDESPGNAWKPRHYIDRFEERFTTPAVLRAERRLLAAAERIADAPGDESPPALVKRAIGRRPTIAAEQAEAVRHLCSGPDLRLMTGDAGTGKTYTIGACLDVWAAEGREVIGCALAGRAADQLQVETGIRSNTLKSTLYRLDRGMLRLKAGSVVVLDEAAMVGTRMLGSLVAHCEDAGARLILLGDAKQIQSIEAGGGFRSLSGRLGEARLREIRRQQEVWRRQAVADLGEGASRKVINAYLERGQLHIGANRQDTLRKLVSKWSEDGGREVPERVLMLASLNDEVTRLNKLAQIERREAGLLGDRRIFLGNSCHAHENDRVQFTRRTRRFGGIENGWAGTVLSADEDAGQISVRLDGGRTVTVALSEYEPGNIRLAYASTVHKAQGATVPVAHVLLGGPLQDKHVGLVAASRSRESTHLFIDEANAGEDCRSAVRQLALDRTKTLATDFIEQHALMVEESRPSQRSNQGRMVSRGR